MQLNEEILFAGSEKENWERGSKWPRSTYPLWDPRKDHLTRYSKRSQPFHLELGDASQLLSDFHTISQLNTKVDPCLSADVPEWNSLYTTE